MINKIIKEAIDDEIQKYKDKFEPTFNLELEDKIDALKTFKSRIPQLTERIEKEIEDELKFMSCTCLKRLEERFINTLKGGKE